MNLFEDFELNLLARANGQFGVGLVLLAMPIIMAVMLIVTYQALGIAVDPLAYVIGGGGFLFMFGTMHFNANAIRKNAGIKEGEAFKDEPL